MQKKKNIEIYPIIQGQKRRKTEKKQKMSHGPTSASP
jgi:hypothetical protein